MSIELDVDAGAALDTFGSSIWDEMKEDSRFHETLFSPPHYPENFGKQAALVQGRTAEMIKANAYVQDQLSVVRYDSPHDSHDRDGEPEVKYQGKVSIEFQPNGEVSISGSFKTEVHDGRGNYVGAEFERRSDGVGTIDLYQGHD